MIYKLLNFMLRVTAFHHCNCLTRVYAKSIYATFTIVLRQTIFIAHGQKFYFWSHKDLSWVPYFLIFFFAIYFSLSKDSSSLLWSPVVSSDSSKITIGNKTISSSKCEKLLGITIDNNLNFKEHI